MLTIIQQPADLVLSRNPIVYKLRATTLAGVGFGATGVRTDIIIAESYFDVGNTIVVKWTEPSGLQSALTFNFVSAMTDNPSELPTNPYPTFTDYLAAIAEKMSKHPLLSPFFTVTWSDDNPYFSLIVTAKNTDDGWAVSLTDSLTSFSQQATYANTAAIADRRPDNHKILYDVFFEPTYRSGNFIRIAQNETYVNQEGYGIFDIKDILDAAFTVTLSSPPIPNFNSTAPHTADNLRRYYVRIAERFGTPATVQNGQYIGNANSPNLVRLGGIAQNLWLDNPDFLNSLTAINRVLSWQPLEKTVTRLQPEWLAFAAQGDGETVKIQYSSVLVDGTMTNEIVANTLTLRYAETVLLPVNIYALGSTVAENVVRYYVTLLDHNDNPISETFTYTIDHLHHESQRYLMFINGFGVPQTLSLTGTFSTTVDFDRTEANTAYAPNGHLAQSGSFTSNTNSERSFVYRTGFLQREDITAIVELWQSEHVFEVFEEGFIPLRLTDKRLKLPETGDYTEGVQIAAAPRINYRNYSNALRFDLTQPATNDWKSEDFDRNTRLAFGLKWA